MKSSSGKFRVLVVEDTAENEGELVALLQSTPGIEAVASAPADDGLYPFCASFCPHVVVWNLRTANVQTCLALETITRDWPCILNVLMTDLSHPGGLPREHGLDGLSHATMAPFELEKAIQAVIQGSSTSNRNPCTRRNCSRNRQEQRKCKSAGNGDAPPAVPLSQREQEIVLHLPRGLTNNDIGQAMGISSQTVKGHLKNIFRKLGAANRAEAVARAHDFGIL